MTGVLFTGLGGAVGAASRYLMCLIPNKYDFPFITLAVNLIGAFLIGFIAGAASAKSLSPNLVLFLKTGICGGFTTFSTFSLETLTLIEKGRMPAAVLYATASLLGCLIGVKLGGNLAALCFK